MAVNKTHRQSLIRAYASQRAKLVRNGSICSGHAMADIWDYATIMYMGFNNDEESYVNDSGFKQKFKDGSNQVQHFAAGVAAGFQYGRYAWIGHRIMRPDSPQDTALNDVSTWLGANLNGIGTSLNEVKVYIMEKVCEAKCGICNNGKGR